MILAIDTTHEFGSLALVEGGVVREELLLHSPDGFGHILFGQLQRLLDRNGVTLAAVDRFAAAAGPGSFTGVRVGLAAAKGLAEAAGRRVVPVSNLEAIASFGRGPLRAAMMDARRGEIYGAVYDGASRLVLPEVVTRFPLWLESLPEGVELVATDFLPFAAALDASRFAAARRTVAPRALAGAVGRLAESRDGCDPAAADANYVRRSDAELHWKEM